MLLSDVLCLLLLLRRPLLLLLLLCVGPINHQGANGAVLYDYEYELDSTRGKKRILNTVTITGRPGGWANGLL